VSSGIVQNLKTASQAKPVVLIVDDRPTTRSLVRSVLEGADYRVFEAADGQTALDMIETHHPDMVLLDIIMPGMDGLETLRRLRQRWDEIELPVIMLTVKDTLSDIVTTLEMGATDFLSKPINFPILMARLNRHLHRKRLADQLQQMRDTLEQKVDFRTRQLAEQGRELEKSLDELSHSEERYSSFYDDTPALFMTLDVHGTIVSINRYGAQCLGFDGEDLTGIAVTDIFHPNQSSPLRIFVTELATSESSIHGRELLMSRKDGERVWVRLSGRAIRRAGGELELLLAGEDITESHQLADRLAHLSAHDELTGLVNRVELTRRLEQQIELGAERNLDHALCLLDIDQFRVINDTRGHVIGDRYLAALARKLGSLLGPSDLVARVGGDEFALLLNRVNAESARALAERIRLAVEIFRVQSGGDSVGATASIGVAPIRCGSSNVAEVMTRADAACLRARQAGGNTVFLFNEDDLNVERHYDEMNWVSQIRTALDGDLFELFAQEIQPAKSDAGLRPSLELLLRVRKGDGSYVPNSDVLSAVAEFQLAQRVDHWVVENAFRFLAKREVTADHAFGFSLNVSGQSLGQPAFINHVLDQLRRYHIPPELICFEVTETAAITNIETAVEFFNTMRRLGCRIALDDFGSGLSSYAYLKQIPADLLKIDGSLIRGMEQDDLKFAIVDSIIRLAHRIDKKVVAEHVENELCRSRLQELGVDYLQGHLLGEARSLYSFFPD